MSTLTKNERDGLDEVFMCIHTQGNKYEKIKEISTFIMSHTHKFNLPKLIKVARDGLNETRTSQFWLNLTKKKKNLSK